MIMRVIIMIITLIIIIINQWMLRAVSFLVAHLMSRQCIVNVLTDFGYKRQLWI